MQSSHGKAVMLAMLASLSCTVPVSVSLPLLPLPMSLPVPEAAHVPSDKAIVMRTSLD